MIKFFKGRKNKDYGITFLIDTKRSSNGVFCGKMSLCFFNSTRKTRDGL